MICIYIITVSNDDLVAGFTYDNDICISLPAWKWDVHALHPTSGSGYGSRISPSSEPLKTLVFFCYYRDLYYIHILANLLWIMIRKTVFNQLLWYSMRWDRGVFDGSFDITSHIYIYAP